MAEGLALRKPSEYDGDSEASIIEKSMIEYKGGKRYYSSWECSEAIKDRI